MGLVRVLIVLFTASLFFPLAQADDVPLERRVMELEKRMLEFERRLEELSPNDRWKDPTLWRRIKKGMTTGDIRKLLGKPRRIEEQIFTTWYYHPTSKLHSYVWFDEGKVLGRKEVK